MAAKKKPSLYPWLERQAKELGVLDEFEQLDPNEHLPGYRRLFFGQSVTNMSHMLRALDTIARDPSIDAIFSSAHSLIWRMARPLRSNQWTRTQYYEPGRTRLELEQWAYTHGISDLLDVSIDDITSEARLYLRTQTYAINKLCVGDVLSKNALQLGNNHAIHHISNSILSALQDHSKQRKERWRELQNDIAHPKPHDHVGAIEVQITGIRQLLEESMRSGIAPYSGAGYASFSMNTAQASATLKCSSIFSCHGARQQPEVLIEFARSAPALSCNCDASSQRRHCPLKTLALGRALNQLLLYSPDNAQCKTLTEALSQSRFERLLGAVLDGLEENAKPIPEELDGEPCVFGWRVEGSNEEGFKVRPALIRGKKRSTGVVSKLFTDFERVTDLFEQITDAREQLLLTRWEAYDSKPRSYDHNAYIDAIEIIASLADHPHAYYHTTRTYKLEVVHHVGKLKVTGDTEDPDEPGIQLVFGDQVLKPHMIANALEVLGQQGYAVKSLTVDDAKERAHLELWSLSRAALKQADKLERILRVPIDEEARTSIVKTAPRLVQNPNFELGESLRGERVDPRETLVIKLTIQAPYLELSVLAAPLASGTLHTPGEGAPISYAITPSGIFNAERDLSGEARRAKSLEATIGLERDRNLMRGSHAWTLRIDDAVFDLLERIEAHAATTSAGELEVIWDTSQFKIAGHIPSSSLALEVNAADRYLSIGGTASLEQDHGTRAIPLAQLLEAARQGKRWIQLEDESWAKISDALRDSIDRVGALLGIDDAGEVHAQVSPLAAPALMALASDMEVEVTGPVAWLELSDRIEAARKSDPEVPESFEGELRSYQREGYQWLWRLSQWAPGACLADDMGLGKTIQALALLLARAEEGPALLVGPTSLGFNWQRECKRFAPGLVFKLVRSSAELEQLDKPGEGELVYMSYDLASRNETWCQEQDWATLVLDEAQAIKNAATQRAKAIHNIQARFALALTGTPLENHTGELWSLLQVVAPGLLGTQGSFRRTYQLPIEQRGDRQARATLAALISPFVLRRAKSQVARDLPERTDIRLDIELSSKERQLYDELRRSALDEMANKDEEQNNRFELLAVITRLRQIACHPKLYRPALDVPSSKLEALFEKLEEVRQEGHHALVFSQFTSLLSLVEEGLAERGFRTATLTGETPAGKRGELVDAFQNGEQDVFLLSIKAGGVGLNLTRASFVFVLDPWWNPAVEDQATDRAHRIGQNKPVTVYKLVALDTVEEVIYQMHETKRELLDAVMAGSGSARALSLRELEAMVAGDYSTLEIQAPEARQEAERIEFSPDDASLDEEVLEEKQATKHDGKRVSTPTSASKISLAGWTKASLDAAIDTYLKDRVSSGELAEGSANVYDRRVKLLAEYVITLDTLPEDLANTYKKAIRSGKIDRTKTDETLATTSARHLLVVLERDGAP